MAVDIVPGQPKKGKKTRGGSGNPAKRAAAARGGAAPAAAPSNPADAFGFGGAKPTNEAEMRAAMQDFQLPPQLQQMFNQNNLGPR